MKKIMLLVWPLAQPTEMPIPRANPDTDTRSYQFNTKHELVFMTSIKGTGEHGMAEINLKQARHGRISFGRYYFFSSIFRTRTFIEVGCTMQNYQLFN